MAMLQQLTAEQFFASASLVIHGWPSGRAHTLQSRGDCVSGSVRKACMMVVGACDHLLGRVQWDRRGSRAEG
jgi:hypothetical protein